LGYNTYIHGYVTLNSLYSYLKQTKVLFVFLLHNWRTGGQNRSCMGVRDQWEGEDVGKVQEVNMACCAHMFHTCEK
jgi:hypothetical protein